LKNWSFIMWAAVYFFTVMHVFEEVPEADRLPSYTFNPDAVAGAVLSPESAASYSVPPPPEDSRRYHGRGTAAAAVLAMALAGTAAGYVESQRGPGDECLPFGFEQLYNAPDDRESITDGSKVIATKTVTGAGRLATAGECTGVASSPERQTPRQEPDRTDHGSRSNERTAPPAEEADAAPAPQLTAEQKRIIKSLKLSKEQKAFLTEAILIIQDPEFQAKAKGVNLVVMLAQAGQESRWGQDLLAKKYNNPFGMKWFGEGDKTPPIRTFEHTANGEVYYIKVPFRSFKTLEEGLEAYAKYIRGKWFYQDALNKGISGTLDGLLRGGPAYATDVNYKKNVMDRIKQFKLVELVNAGHPS
jgi:flagellum-specific peptidoglycan hydrolase FlgJ